MINHSTKTINTWWPTAPKPGNFGDILTPWLINKISGYTATYVNKPFSKPTLLAIGSILQMASQETTIWGSGLMYKTTNLNPRAKYLAVRGPITRSLLLEQNIQCPAVFGDPALLLPKYYNPEISKRYSIGIFAHYVDTALVKQWYNTDNDILIIDPLNSQPTEVVDQILQCDKIVSSSLHGIIVSQAYGVPACWVKHSTTLHGDDTKFYDYFESVKVKMKHIDFYEKIDKREMEMFNYVKDITFDPVPLLQAFPIKT